MFRLTLKNLVSHKLRLLTTSLVVLISVAFIVGSLGLAATLNKVFDDVFAGAFQKVDVVVRGAEQPVQTDFDASREPIEPALVQQVEDVPGVFSAVGYTEFPAQVLDANGDRIGGNGPPASGANWLTDTSNPFQISEGRAPESANEVAIDAGTAKQADAKVGQTLQVVVKGQTVEGRLVGIAKFGDLDSAAGTNYVFFTNARAFELQGAETFTEIDVVGDDGVDAETLRSRIDSALLPAIDVVTGEQAADEAASALKSGLSFLTIIPLVFGVIALVVSAFVINNIFTILLAQRAREMALLRAIGARRGQVLGSVIVEAFIVGLIASVLGLVAGSLISAGLLELLKAVISDFPSQSFVLSPTMVIVGLVAGVGITMLSAFLPAVRSSKIPPIAALREVAVGNSSTSIKRLVLGIVIAVLAAVLLVLGGVSGIATQYLFPAGLLAVLLAVYVWGPMYAKPLAAVLGWPAARLRGTAGSLARQNAMRNPRRTAATSAALMIGVTLVSLAIVLLSSFQATGSKLVDQTVGGDIIVTTDGSAGPQESTLDNGLVERISQLPQIADSTAVGAASTLIDGTLQAGIAVDPESFAEMIKLDFSQGSIDDLTPGTVAVLKDVADTNGWSVGDTVTLRFNAGEPTPVRISGVFDDGTIAGQFVLPKQTEQDITGSSNTDILFLTQADDVTTDQAKAAVDAATEGFTGVQVLDQSDLKEQFQTIIDLILNIILALLALAIVIALFGIANTLSLSIFERTREIGLLRAVGMTRRQTRTMIRWESVTLSLAGTVVGLILGVVISSGVVFALREQGLDALSVPWTRLLIVGIVAVICGFLVAIFPARRASRLNVLKAISAE